MIKDVIIRKSKKFDDKRGWIVEVFRGDEIKYQPIYSYVSVTNPGVIRGPHEHKEQSDYFIFVGPGSFKVYLWDNRKDSPTFKVHETIEAGENSPMSILVPPGIVHGYKCISTEPAYSINLPDKLYRGDGGKEEVDEIRWESDLNSPFKI